jgi:hypothetical protein
LPDFCYKGWRRVAPLPFPYYNLWYVSNKPSPNRTDTFQRIRLSESATFALSRLKDTKSKTTKPTSPTRASWECLTLDLVNLSSKGVLQTLIPLTPFGAMYLVVQVLDCASFLPFRWYSGSRFGLSLLVLTVLLGPYDRAAVQPSGFIVWASRFSLVGASICQSMLAL